MGDVAIVGSGAGGAAAAENLAEKGLDSSTELWEPTDRGHLPHGSARGLRCSTRDEDDRSPRHASIRSQGGPVGGTRGDQLRDLASAAPREGSLRSGATAKGSIGRCENPSIP